ncbi:MAG: hypothetical protein KJ593_00110 [Candidatus Omnitrophica bacterium]|nr:hypothetical protein [Candidatus Omnitrophota bacterium]
MNKLCIILIALSFLCLQPKNILAQDVVSAKDLIENSQDYDGKAIVYQGEAVGDIMVRGNFFWINILDHTCDTAIGIWAPVRLKPLIRFVGTHGVRGDYIEIQGIFNVRCKAHGGDLDIHAQNLATIEKGKFLPEKINPERKRLALYLSLGVLCLLILSIFRNRR